MNSCSSNVIGMCQLMLGGGGVVSSERIAEVVDQVCGMKAFEGVDRAELQRVLEERFTVYMPPALILDGDDGHEDWLDQKRPEISWKFWDRYKLHISPKMPAMSFDLGVDRVTSDVLSRLEDPERPGMWDRRGLVVGHVQSGKTANYTGLIAKAADAGYKVIIVLTGMHESLRCQTQIRLDEGFLGRKSQPRGSGAQSFVPTGVGLLDPSVRANTGTSRFQGGDFNAAVAAQFGISPGGLPLLFVVKKNSSVLKNIISWITTAAVAHDPETGRKFVPGVPVLVVDDEADQASVDTGRQKFDEYGQPDPEHNPKTINRQIRQILRLFERVAYVGYTATPFANIFIHDKGSTPDHGDDLFPRSFIVNIPHPDNYVGPAKVFGLDNDPEVGLVGVEALPLVRTVSDHADTDDDEETEGWMPPRQHAKTAHIPLYDGESRVPPSLREAILSFLLAATVRSVRALAPAHNSMLIHVTRFTDVQKRVAVQVETELKDTVRRLVYGDGSRTPSIVDEMRGLWELSEGSFIETNLGCARILGSDVPDLPSWDEVQAALPQLAKSVRVKIINGEAADILDYEEHKEGLNVIAIGGDKLSRGLTLEGLSVSYFLRSSKMYDTLMQMGRWFGYRDGYVDVCRLYIPSELIEWFGHIAMASEELRVEFEKMVANNGTPTEYGLKVRAHPVLLVTSAVKMANGTTMKLSFSGDVAETIIFDRNPDWLDRNRETTEAWLDGLCTRASGTKAGGYIWNDVTSGEVLQLLKSSGYRTHKDARRADAAILARYIEAQVAIGELTDWTVKLCSSGLSDAKSSAVCGKAVGLIRRQPFPVRQQRDRYTIRRLVSPSDERTGIGTVQLDDALASTRERWFRKPEKERDGKQPPDNAGGREIRAVRGKNNGLLLLYPLNSAELGSPQPERGVVMGLAISFPASDTAKEITYRVNKVYGREDDDGDA
ncbi:Z1 domain-containing protein [Lysobacter arenosi]|uniref:Z1 domain-containing protein n=1 Tax=Lysobacter arenosi TaxID=2795387 RepID=A0ABX7R963_9GAMM|nr:Z1 domain-containing protein [Lysobacter arenosi]QSX74604.1 Z1 domain-containing protein [Lysobacter arenosi]